MRKDNGEVRNSLQCRSAKRVPVAHLECWMVAAGEFLEPDVPDILCKRGIRLWQESDPAVALQQVEARVGVDCILVDTTHDEAEAFRFIDAVRYAARLRGWVPPAIIGVTGATDLGALKRLFIKDVDDLLPRPPGSGMLVEAVMRGAALTRVRREFWTPDAIERLSHINRRMEGIDLKEHLKYVVPGKNLALMLRAFEEQDTSPHLGL